MKWTEGVSRLPLGPLIAVTLPAWFLALGALLWLFAVPTFDERKRIEIVGKVQEVTSPLVQLTLDTGVVEQTVLDFALHDQPVRFRVESGIFEDALNEEVPPQLRPGATVRLQVDESQYSDPFSPEPYRVPTVTVYAIRIGDSQVLTLEASRRWHEGSRRLYAWPIVLLSAAGAVFLSAIVLRSRRR